MISHCNNSRGLYHIFILVGTIIFISKYASGSESAPLAIDDKIAQAREIWILENPDKMGDADRLKILGEYASSASDILSTIALRKLLSSHPERISHIISKNTSEKTAIALEFADIINKAKKPNLIAAELLALSQNRKIPMSNISFIREELISQFISRGWLDFIPADLQYNPAVTTARLRGKVEHLTSSEKIRVLIELLTRWESPLDYEAAIILLAEENYGVREFISHSLELWEDKIIPEPPPYTRAHTDYFVIIMAAKSIPDLSYIPKLKSLASSENKYIAEKATDALQWVESGVAYPMKYYRLLW